MLRPNGQGIFTTLPENEGRRIRTTDSTVYKSGDISLSVVFILPSYLAIFHKVLWGNQSPGEENVTTRKSKKTKQKAITRLCFLEEPLFYFISPPDCEDVRSGDPHIRFLLAAVSRLLHHFLFLSSHHEGMV